MFIARIEFEKFVLYDFLCCMSKTLIVFALKIRATIAKLKTKKVTIFSASSKVNAQRQNGTNRFGNFAD